MEKSSGYMLAETIASPEEYLAYSKEVFAQTDLFHYPKIQEYYQRLCTEFKAVYINSDLPFFSKMGKLLAIDAQLMILQDLFNGMKQSLTEEFGMSEEEVIQMIKHDKNYFYRELTGESWLKEPKWGLIYLSEKRN